LGAKTSIRRGDENGDGLTTLEGKGSTRKASCMPIEKKSHAKLLASGKHAAGKGWVNISELGGGGGSRGGMVGKGEGGRKGRREGGERTRSGGGWTIVSPSDHQRMNCGADVLPAGKGGGGDTRSTVREGIPRTRT